MLEPLASIHPDALTREFWEACARRELRVQRCLGCGAFRLPPLPGCRECGDGRSEWVRLSGRGRVFSHTTVVHPALPDLQEEVPYGVVVVELEGAPGARLISNVLDCPPEELRVGMELELAWDEPAPGVLLPRFRPAGAPG